MKRRSFPTRRGLFPAVLALVASVALADAAVASGALPDIPAKASKIEYPADPYQKRFQTVNDARPFVLFDIRTPTLSSGYRVSAVFVETTPIRDLQRNLNRVTISYIAPDNHPLTLVQADVAGKAPTQRADSVANVVVNGATGLAISSRNIGGRQVGSVFWTQGGITYWLITTDMNGVDLLPLARTVTG